MGNPVTLARQAMATRFEIVLYGDNPVALRAAGEEALAEIDHWENQLSLYRPTSEIAHLNARAAQEWVRVSPRVFQLLQLAQRLSEETRGAFDITLGPLIRCWGFMRGNGARPDPQAVAAARAVVGMPLVHFDEGSSAIHFSRPGVMLDLGAIGKGYALECAAQILREAGVQSALIHGGTSSVQAIGHPPESEFWRVALENPPPPPTHDTPAPPDHAIRPGPISAAGSQARRDDPSALLAVVPLRDEALSVSAVWGKSFQSEGKEFGHIIDPRTGAPTAGALLTAVALPSATETDALSTALLAAGFEGFDRITRLRDGMRSLVVGVHTDGHTAKVASHGIELCPGNT